MSPVSSDVMVVMGAESIELTVTRFGLLASGSHSVYFDVHHPGAVKAEVD